MTPAAGKRYDCRGCEPDCSAPVRTARLSKMRRFLSFTLRLRRAPGWVRYISATVFVLFAYMIHVLALTPAQYPYLLFFPAVILAAVLFDHGSGFWAILLSTILIVYRFLPPSGSLFVSSESDLLAVSLYVGLSFITVTL